MRIYLTLFLIVNLFIFAHGLDRARALHRQSRKHANDAQTTQSKKVGDAHVTTNAAAAGAAAGAAVASAATKTAASVKSAATTKATAAKATTTTTTAAKTDAKATAKTAAAAKATTQAKATDNKAAAGAASAASSKLFTKDASGKTIEHVTKEAPPKGMVRPVMVPGPDQVPNTFTVHPIVEPEAGMTRSYQQDNSQQQPMSPDQQEQQPEVQPTDAAPGQTFTSNDNQPFVPATDDSTSPAPSTSPEEDDSDNTSESSESDEEEEDQPQFKETTDKTAAKTTDKKYWGGYDRPWGKDAVTADEVSSLSNEANADDDNFPPKFPPCSCESQPQPECCSMSDAMGGGGGPTPRGWWHKNARGNLHFHHMHTSDEAPEQIMSENEQNQDIDSGNADDAAAAASMANAMTTSPSSSDASSSDASSSSDPSAMPDTSDDTTNSASVTSDGTTAGMSDAPTDSATAAAASAATTTASSTEAVTDQTTAGVSMPNIRAALAADLAAALQKNHDTIVADIQTQLAGVQSQFSSHLDDEKASTTKLLNSIIARIAHLESQDGQRAVIVENNIHHHHHHDGDDDDDDDDDDDHDSLANDALGPDAFTSTGDASTLDVLKKMEASSEDLSNKLDEADALDAAASADENSDS